MILLVIQRHAHRLTKEGAVVSMPLTPAAGKRGGHRIGYDDEWVVMDPEAMGLSNVDMSLIRESLQRMEQYFPAGYAPPKGYKPENKSAPEGLEFTSPSEPQK